jgi:hypothetical protein
MMTTPTIDEVLDAIRATSSLPELQHALLAGRLAKPRVTNFVELMNDQREATKRLKALGIEVELSVFVRGFAERNPQIAGLAETLNLSNHPDLVAAAARLTQSKAKEVKR